MKKKLDFYRKRIKILTNIVKICIIMKNYYNSHEKWSKKEGNYGIV